MTHTADSRHDDPDETEEDYEPPCGDLECTEFHCGRCDEHAGHQGHWTSFCKIGNGRTDPHFCCPGTCENTE